jgi:hypothetical protein
MGLSRWVARLSWFVAGVVVALIVQRVLALREGLRQVNNLVKGRAYVAALASYRGSHHSYPARLELALRNGDLSLDGRDAWGTPLLYKSDGARFVVVSAGADQRFDYYGDPMDLRLATVTSGNAPSAFWSICADPAQDQVMSDLGEHRVCGK